jgi:hypothetical protein
VLTSKKPLKELTDSNKTWNTGRVLVAHVCNPSYSGGRDQEALGSKPVWANSSRDPVSKIPITKKGAAD